MYDITYEPQKYGVKLITDVGDGGGYDWDCFTVWKSIEGNTFYWGADSGCSCTSPFEDLNSLADLTSGTAQQAHDALDTWFAEDWHTVSAETVADAHLDIAQA